MCKYLPHLVSTFFRRDENEKLPTTTDMVVYIYPYGKERELEEDDDVIR